MLLAATILALAARPLSADLLLGTIGSGNMLSTLVEIDQDTGLLMRVIGPVGYKVNGLAWDRASGKLYATTSVKDASFHGLITIDPLTGAGAPVDQAVINFGLGLGNSPVMAITIDPSGQMVGWYQEFHGTTDTYVMIDKTTGVAEEFGDTGIEAARLGLSFNGRGELWLIDSPAGGDIQVAYLLDPANGKPVLAELLSPPTAAALGDFSPGNGHYYGVSKDPFGANPSEAYLVVVNVKTGKVKMVGRTVDDLHVITFVKPPLPR